MDPSPEVILQAEAAWGIPVEVSVDQPLLAWELDLIERVCGDRRHHDVTIFVRKGDSLAMVRKPSDPPDVWWVPAGGVDPGESLGGAAVREVWEEAGVRSRVERYLIRMTAVFHCGDRRRCWTSHVIGAAWESADPHPVDTHEVEAARWVSGVEFAEQIVPRMIASGWGRLEYRVRMAALASGLLGLPGSIGLPPHLQ